MSISNLLLFKSCAPLRKFILIFTTAYLTAFDASSQPYLSVSITPFAFSSSRMISPTSGTVIWPAYGFLILMTGVVIGPPLPIAQTPDPYRSSRSLPASGSCSNRAAASPMILQFSNVTFSEYHARYSPFTTLFPDDHIFCMQNASFVSKSQFSKTASVIYWNEYLHFSLTLRKSR